MMLGNIKASGPEKLGKTKTIAAYSLQWAKEFLKDLSAEKRQQYLKSIERFEKHVHSSNEVKLEFLIGRMFQRHLNMLEAKRKDILNIIQTDRIYEKNLQALFEKNSPLFLEDPKDIKRELDYLKHQMNWVEKIKKYGLEEKIHMSLGIDPRQRLLFAMSINQDTTFLVEQIIDKTEKLDKSKDFSRPPAHTHFWEASGIIDRHKGAYKIFSQKMSEEIFQTGIHGAPPFYENFVSLTKIRKSFLSHSQFNKIITDQLFTEFYLNYRKDKTNQSPIFENYVSQQMLKIKPEEYKNKVNKLIKQLKESLEKLPHAPLAPLSEYLQMIIFSHPEFLYESIKFGENNQVIPLISTLNGLLKTLSGKLNYALNKDPGLAETHKNFIDYLYRNVHLMGILSQHPYVINQLKSILEMMNKDFTKSLEALNEVIHYIQIESYSPYDPRRTTAQENEEIANMFLGKNKAS